MSTQQHKSRQHRDAQTETQTSQSTLCSPRSTTAMFSQHQKSAYEALLPGPMLMNMEISTQAGPLLTQTKFSHLQTSVLPVSNPAWAEVTVPTQQGRHSQEKICAKPGDKAGKPCTEGSPDQEREAEGEGQIRSHLY